MFSLLRNRFGIPGVISVIALVFAMLGGAYAASNNGGGKATASAKGKRGPRGPKGATGPAGANGTPGAQGSVGLAGANGKDGGTGPAGPTGATGATGEEGPEGPEGSPWTADGTLPPGSTETGTFAFTEYGASIEFQPLTTDISFPIPLAAELGETKVHMVREEEWQHAGGKTVPADCAVEGVEGTSANPLAQPGALCVFVASYEGLIAPNAILKLTTGGLEKGASTSGARLFFFKAEGAAPATAAGTFAVTG